MSDYIRKANQIMFIIFFLTLLLETKHAVTAAKKHRGDNSHESEWSYKGNRGPEFWPNIFVACGGRFQAPVDIEENQLEQEESLDSITLMGYHDNLSGCIAENNGHTVVIRPSGRPPGIKDGGLGDYYEFDNLHFHWGDDSKKGSEHTINNQSFPLEIHFVHRNEHANSDGGPGLAILSVLVQEKVQGNPHFAPITNVLKYIKHRDSTVIISEPLNLRLLLPDELSHYYRYVGSLTTPPCTEGVIWTVYAAPMAIGTGQLQAFRTLKSNIRGSVPHEPLVNNFRFLQKLNRRKIMEAIPYC